MSNSRPSDYETDALPVEPINLYLFFLFLFINNIFVKLYKKYTKTTQNYTILLKSEGRLSQLVDQYDSISCLRRTSFGPTKLIVIPLRP